MFIKQFPIQQCFLDPVWVQQQDSVVMATDPGIIELKRSNKMKFRYNLSLAEIEIKYSMQKYKIKVK